MFSQLSDHSTHLLNKKSTFKEVLYVYNKRIVIFYIEEEWCRLI